MSLRKAFKRIGGALRAAAPIASLVPGPIGIAGMAVTALGAARAQSRATAETLPQPIMAAALPASIAPVGLGLPALGAVGGAIARVLPGGAVAAGRVAGAVVGRGIAMGRGLIGAANRWCMRNPKSCAALGGATVVADMMRSGEIKRPRRRINPLNVRAMRRAVSRVKAGRKICMQIERLLPTRRSRSYGSPGVITRREAARALRR